MLEAVKVRTLGLHHHVEHFFGCCTADFDPGQPLKQLYNKIGIFFSLFFMLVSIYVMSYL